MMTPFEWVVGDSSKDHTVTALTSVTTSPVTERYTTMRDSTAEVRDARAAHDLIARRASAVAAIFYRLGESVPLPLVARELARLGGSAEQVRQWLLPVWQHMVDLPDSLAEHHALKLILALESGLDDVDAAWLARIEAAQQANPRDNRLQYLAGMACAQRQLWGKAQQLLTQAAPQLHDAVLRRNAWRKLATLAEQRGDAQAAAQAWKKAALAD